MTRRPTLLVLVIALAMASMTAAPVLARDADPAKRITQLRAQADALEPAGRFAQADTCLADPTGDVTPSHPSAAQADITRLCGPSTGTAEFAVELVATPQPTTDPNWVNGVTGWIIVIDVDGDGAVDYDALWWNDGSGTTFDVRDVAADQVTCSRPAVQSGKRLSGSIPAACLGGATGGVYDSAVIYDSQWDDPNAPLLIDDLANATPEAAPQPAPAPQPGPSTPVAQSKRQVQRLAGPSRIETSIEISRYQFPDGASEVYLSRADEFADSISSGSLTRGPVLLVPRCGPVPGSVLAEVRRLDPAKVVPLGGEGAVCDQVVADVANA